MSNTLFWVVAPALAIGTFLLRGVFLAYLTTRRPGAEWARALKYTPAAILPAIAMPLIVFDQSGALQSAPERLIGAAVTIAIGLATRNVLWTVLGGMASVWLTTALQSL